MPALHTYSVSTRISSVGASSEVHAIRVLTPSTRRARLVSLEISTANTGATDNAGRLRVYRGVTSGLSAGTGATPTPMDQAAPAALATATTQMTGTPSGGVVLVSENIAAQGALLIRDFPAEGGPVANISTPLDITVTGGGTALSNVDVTLTFEE